MRWRAALLLAALGVGLTPWPHAWIERYYSTSLYLLFQRRITAASNAAPVTLLDVAAGLAAAVWLTRICIDAFGAYRGRRRRVFARSVGRTVVGAAALYLAFMAAWGLNYRRTPLAEKLRFDAKAVSPQRALALAVTAGARLNALYAGAHATPPAAAGDISEPLAVGFARAQRDLGATRLALPGRPKRSLLDPYFQRAAVEGMTDPLFLETLVQSGLLPVERPFVVAHEWSHLAGYADEGEANFVGWLTCLRSSDADQYSGWLFLYSELLAGLPGSDRAAVAGTLASGPRDDLRAIDARIRRHISPRLSAAGWRVYDRYLKANRVEAGAASYAGVIRLVLGVRFEAGWRPQIE